MCCPVVANEYVGTRIVFQRKHHGDGVRYFVCIAEFSIGVCERGLRMAKLRRSGDDEERRRIRNEPRLSGLGQAGRTDDCLTGVPDAPLCLAITRPLEMIGTKMAVDGRDFGTPWALSTFPHLDSKAAESDLTGDGHLHLSLPPVRAQQSSFAT